MAFCYLPYLCPNIIDNDGSVLGAGHDPVANTVAAEKRSVGKSVL